MNLSVYLTELLKTNDCVIVPDLGGFVANYQTSGYDVQGDQFSPPSKEIIFSGKLKKNDGLLVNYVGEKEGVGYLEARKIVSEFVSECLFKLENGERVEFEKIGSLYFDENDHLLFDADPYASLRMDAFGLDSFHFPQLVNKYNQSPPVFKDKAPEPQRIRRQVVKYLLVGLPILAALYFIPLNILLKHGDLSNPRTSNTASLSVKDSPVALNADVPVTPAAIPANPPTAQSEPKTDAIASGMEVKEEVHAAEPLITTDHAPVIPAATATKISQPEKTIVAHSTVSQPKVSVAKNPVKEPSKGKFHVVGGCFKVRENADKLAERLVKQGYHAQVSAMGKSFFRVSVESYQTRKEAEKTMIKLLEAEPETGYWLMADKR